MRDHTFFWCKCVFLFCYRYLQEFFYIDLHFDFMNVFDWRLREVCVWVWRRGVFYSFYSLFICLFVCVCFCMCTILCWWERVCMCVYTVSVWVWMGIVVCISKYLCVIIENKSWRFYWRLNGIKSNSCDCYLNRTALHLHFFIPFIKFYAFWIDINLKSLCFQF